MIEAWHKSVQEILSERFAKSDGSFESEIEALMDGLALLADFSDGTESDIARAVAFAVIVKVQKLWVEEENSDD